jgi:hypothetical protein
MSAAPNYMIDVFHVENINLSEEQINNISGWSMGRHTNAVAAHGEIAQLEELVRDWSLSKKPKTDILKKMQEMEKIRHKITTTKTACRDFMKNEVLTEKQWKLLINKIK